MFQSGGKKKKKLKFSLPNIRGSREARNLTSKKTVVALQKCSQATRGV